MANSMYLHIWYVNPKAKFKEFVQDNNLPIAIHDVLIGLKKSYHIWVNGFCETKDNGILIEIPKTLLNWQTKIGNYLNNHPEIKKAKLLTKEQAWLTHKEIEL